jgi:protein-tyrosine phosphatase
VYGVIFAIVGVALLALAALRGGLWWLAAWPSASFLTIAIGYFGAGPVVFGKRSTGGMAPGRVALLLPYLLLLWTIWYLVRFLRREPCSHRFAPGRWLGRRPLQHEVPEGVDLIVDLTSEFPESSAVIAGRTYWCLPILDASVPSEPQLDDLVRRIAAWPGEALIHCASGAGRSALVAAALLLLENRVGGAAKAEESLRQIRHAVRLQPAQRALLRRWDARRRETSPNR